MDASANQESVACPNCGAPVTGPWCSGCGQETGAGSGALARTARRQWQRIWHSLTALVLRPGQLTAEFRDGQRARSVTPWRLAFNVVAVFLVLSFVTNFRVATIADQDASGTFAAAISATAQRAHLDKAVLVERLDRRFNTLYSLLVTLSVACYALLARVTHWRRKERWSVHVVFALHFVAWTFIANLIYFLVMRVFGLSVALSVSAAAKDPMANYASIVLIALILIWQLAYMTIAFRRVYADAWTAAGAKALLGVVVGVTADNAVAFLAFWLAARTI
jgi:hypothetical protein